MSAPNRPSPSNPEADVAHVLIVGASLGGLRAAEALRALGLAGAITIAGAEAHMPYNRPPLSKDVLLGKADAAAILTEHSFKPKAALDDVTWRLGVAVARVDLGGRRAILADGSEIAFDALVAASGLRPRRLAQPGAEGFRFVLRNLEDAIALRARLRPGVRVAVIGGGFIGCEVASSAARLGCAVSIIEPLAAPMQRALGPELGAALQALHQAAGIAIRTNRAVVGFETAPDDQVLRAVHLDDGSELAADLVVEALGSLPNVEWLQGNGLDLSDGVLCDGHLAMAGAAHAVAVGDVARFPNAFADDVPRRIEHWSIPGVTARRAADHLVRQLSGSAPSDAPFAPIPTFWSDQLGLRIQSAGMPGLADRRALLSGDLAPDALRRDGVAMGYWRGGRLIGAVGVGLSPARFAPLQAQVAAAMQNGSA
jgi:3-phenylpropionate/trans-cinnamate dioxygenase ferredoxin reductase subunit